MENNQNNNQNQPQTSNSQTQNQSNAAQNSATPTIDYDKIQQMLNGTLAAKEDTVLKAYFKQQGLSQEELEQAVATFKQQKAAKQPDVTALKGELDTYKQQALKAEIEKTALFEVLGLGVDVKTAPYVIKMADLSSVLGQDGKINQETIKTAVSKVLEDIPGLKPSQAQVGGFVQVGTGTTGDNQTQADNAALRAAFGLK
jgi:hypothetical protein|uniref:Scaffolding protein n=1 Tax=Siphoviridae sp. ctFiA6 TaxID=2823573 RepID=A0A8S5LGQ1_9CAUD|nr:MAG TPA: hypothetical protein [Siphoviridae sp. ctFiA6]